MKPTNWKEKYKRYMLAFAQLTNLANRRGFPSHYDYWLSFKRINDRKGMKMVNDEYYSIIEKFDLKYETA